MSGQPVPSSISREQSGGILGLIPARGGSRGIPRKNLALLAGKPLIQYTFEAALQSRALDRVVLSTDDREIAELGKACGIEVPFMRPSELAADTSPMAPVAQHAVAWLKERQRWYIRAMVLLQPTSPLRLAWHIDEAVRLFRQTDADGVIGVCEVKEHPYDLVSFSGGQMQPAVDRPRPVSRRQDFPRFYFVNGAIYLVRTPVLMQQHTLLPRRSVPYLMDRRHSLDVDTPLDLRIAECLLKSCSEQSPESRR